MGSASSHAPPAQAPAVAASQKAAVQTTGEPAEASHDDAGGDDDLLEDQEFTTARVARLSIATKDNDEDDDDRRRRRLSVVGGQAEATPVAQPPAEADAFPADGAAAATGGVWHALVSVAGQEPGYRKTNQDTAFLLANWGGADDTTLIGVFDGHGPHGHSVAGHLREAVPPAMRDGMSGGGGVSHGLRSAFGHVDRALCRGGSSGIDTDFSGSTAVVGLMAGENLTVAWTGDSRAVVGRRLRGGGFTAVALTEDHKPDNPGEAARIASVGGRVEQLVDDKGTRVGPHRVWLRSVWTPGLAMSRALGDAVAHTAGVSSEPEVTQHVLTHDDVVIVFATDGLWEFVTNEEAIQLACGQPTPAAAARVLVDEAVRRWVEEEDGVCDDTTVVVVFRKGGPQGGSGAGGGAGGGA